MGLSQERLAVAVLLPTLGLIHVSPKKAQTGPGICGSKLHVMSVVHIPTQTIVSCRHVLNVSQWQVQIHAVDTAGVACREVSLGRMAVPCHLQP